MDTDVQAMAQVIYHEARGESEAGRAAVGQVVLNRVRDKRFPNSVYEVIWQPKQFSGMKRYQVPPEFLRIARNVLAGKYPNRVGKSLYFNNFKRKGCYSIIGTHCFY